MIKSNNGNIVINALFTNPDNREDFDFKCFELDNFDNEKIKENV